MKAPNRGLEQARQLARERALYRYSSALERGDFEAVSLVLGEAEGDAALERMVLEMNETYRTEMEGQQGYALQTPPAVEGSHGHRALRRLLGWTRRDRKGGKEMGEGYESDQRRQIPSSNRIWTGLVVGSVVLGIVLAFIIGWGIRGRKLPPLVDPALQDTEWVLTQLRGGVLLKDSHIQLNLGREGFDGFAGCNRYGGEYEAADVGILKFGLLEITLMDCPTSKGVVEQEQVYVEALREASTYRLEDDRLEVQDAAGETILVYVRQEEYAMDPAGLVGTAWRLVSMDGQPPGEGSTLTLAFHDEHRLSGHAGCQDYVSVYEAASDDLHLSYTAMMGPVCPSAGSGRGPEDTLLEQEGAYTTILGWTAHYRLGEGRLELFTIRGETLVYEPLPPEVQPTLEGPTWSLLALVEPNPVEEIPAPLPLPTDVLSGTEITIAFEDGTAQGSAGCNTYQAAYTRNGTSLSFESISVTEMACLTPEGAMEQEQRYLEVLQEAAQAQDHGGQLWLETSDGRALVFSVEASSYGFTDLREDLRAAGLTVEPTGMMVDHGFAIKGRRVLVDDEPIFVYEFGDVATAEAAAAGVSADAGSITVTRTEGDVTIEVHGDWVETPHLYKKGRLIVISGDNPGVLSILDAILGPQFA